MRKLGTTLFFLATLLPTLAFAQFGGGFGGTTPAATTQSDFATRIVMTSWFDKATNQRCLGCVGLNGLTTFTWDATSAAPITLADMATSASPGNKVHFTVGVVSTGQDVVTLSEQPKMEVLIRTAASIAVLRLGVGFESNDTSDLAAADTVGNAAIWFRYSTSASDTTWKACSNDGSTASCTDSGVSVAANTVYRLKIDCAGYPTSCAFYVNDTLKVTKSTNLPASTTVTSSTIRMSTQEAVIKHLEVGTLTVSRAR